MEARGPLSPPISGPAYDRRILYTLYFFRVQSRGNNLWSFDFRTTILEQTIFDSVRLTVLRALSLWTYRQIRSGTDANKSCIFFFYNCFVINCL